MCPPVYACGTKIGCTTWGSLHQNLQAAMTPRRPLHGAEQRSIPYHSMRPAESRRHAGSRPKRGKTAGVGGAHLHTLNRSGVTPQVMQVVVHQ